MNKTKNNHKLIMAVTNDLVSDNRVHKMALTLFELGYSITMVGRKKQGGPKIGKRPYKTFLFDLSFNKGPLFYASFNTKLFFYLIFKPCDVIWANDLDTLPACYYASKIKGAKLVYDSHELYTELPELLERPKVRHIWENIEKQIVPKLTRCITVCKSIADYYDNKYATKFYVIRNLPFINDDSKPSPLPFQTDKQIIIYQGAVNIGRGIEEAILAMHDVENAILLIVGDGDIYQKCKDLVNNEMLGNKVEFTGRIPFEMMPSYTKNATIGLSIEKDMGLNYRFALPNKLFDYIQSGVPVLASSLPEISNIVNTYNVGATINDITPQAISSALNKMLASPENMEMWRNNCKEAAKTLCWENEKEVIKQFL